MAFMFIGAQQANAQYLNTEEALQVLEQEVERVKNLNDPDPQATTVATINSEPARLKAAYMLGAYHTLEKQNDVQSAINDNHSSFTEKHPAFISFANQMKADVEALLTE